MSDNELKAEGAPVEAREDDINEEVRDLDRSPHGAIQAYFY